jgi:hypothetical protein
MKMVQPCSYPKIFDHFIGQQYWQQQLTKWSLDIIHKVDSRIQHAQKTDGQHNF